MTLLLGKLIMTSAEWKCKGTKIIYGIPYDALDRKQRDKLDILLSCGEYGFKYHDGIRYAKRNILPYALLIIVPALFLFLGEYFLF